MFNMSLRCIALLLSVLSIPAQATQNPIVIAIHGGAGTIEKSKFSPEKEQAYRAKLQEAV